MSDKAKAIIDLINSKPSSPSEAEINRVLNEDANRPMSIKEMLGPDPPVLRPDGTIKHVSRT
jgi:hypothetical protein